MSIGKKNAVSNEVDSKIDFIESNLFSGIKDKNLKLDLIVSNPPYIRKKI
ncbi:methyltransferase [Paraclostridium sp. AKS46]|nr:methyltransferase [Paraclostridium sp. AKS46]